MTQSLQRTRRKEMLDRAKEHVRAERLLQGIYFTYRPEPKGCSLGCHFIDVVGRKPKSGRQKTIQDTLSEHYMIPRWLFSLQERVYERLPKSEAQAWHVEFAQAIYDLPDDVDWKLLGGAMRNKFDGLNPLIAHSFMSANKVRRKLLEVLGEFSHARTD